MVYLRTKLATGWSKEEPPIGVKVRRALLFFIPDANPDYDNRMHLIHEWLIEFDDDGSPFREIGLDSEGVPVLAGPDDRNYGFWLDTNMTLKDFTGEAITQEQFEKQWSEFRGFRTPS